MAARPGERIFMCLFLRPDELEAAPGPSEHIFGASLFALGRARSGRPGEHIFARHFLCPDALEVAARPSKPLFVLKQLFAFSFSGNFLSLCFVFCCVYCV